MPLPWSKINIFKRALSGNQIGLFQLPDEKICSPKIFKSKPKAKKGNLRGISSHQTQSVLRASLKKRNKIFSQASFLERWFT